ncbi:MAG: non-hydrolyzing UDP-N-acetylglucosamine 2-epimerase, partial [bacterium]
NFMKVAPVYNELKKIKRFDTFIVHSGQHYDKEMSKVFFDDLSLPRPKIYLGVGSGTHSEQTAKVMIEFEKICIKEKPDLVIVVGDVNTTLAGALTATKLCIPVAHIEAGLRSFDRTMPEEINRILTDHISDFLFTTCEDANENLVKEGIPKSKIFFVGNVMIDTLMRHINIAKKSDILNRLALVDKKYAVLTLHRPSNVDNPSDLKKILHPIVRISKALPVIYPAHPRARAQIEKMRFDKILSNSNVILIAPLGYLDFLCLMSNATFVMTDSGGIQEETTILGIPCLTLRDNTERPITIKQGTNRLVGNDPERIIKEAFSIIIKRNKKERLSIRKIPKYWDGRAGKRIVRILESKL